MSWVVFWKTDYGQKGFLIPLRFFVPTLDNDGVVLTEKKFDRYTPNALFVALRSIIITPAVDGVGAYAVACRTVTCLTAGAGQG